MIDEILNLPDVSFIDDMQLEDVQMQMVRDYQDRYKAITGKDVVLDRADPMSLILYALSIQVYQALLYVDKTGKQDLLKYSYGAYLDNLAAMKGIAREQAKPSRAMIRFTLSGIRPSTVEIPEGIRPSTVEIPEGTRVTNGEVYFQTESHAEIPSGESSVDVAAECMTSGVVGNNLEVGEINILVDPVPYVAKVANTEPTTGGADIEDDDTLKDRIYIAPSKYSVAGPEESYRYWVKTYNSNISDVLICSDDPVDVVIEFIMNDGELPSESMLLGVQKFLSDEQIRPLTDRVTVKAPETVEYKVNVKYFVNQSDLKKVDTIKTAVNAAVDDYIQWQRSKIGRDINPSQLIQQMVSAGAKRVEVTLPVFQVIGKANVAKLSSKTVTYGGLEDD